MATNLILQHKGHPKKITSLKQGGTGPGRHYGRVDCVLCKKFVRWASKEEVVDYLTQKHYDEIMNDSDWPVTSNTFDFCKEKAEYQIEKLEVFNAK